MAVPTPITLDDDNSEKKEKTYNFDHGNIIDLTPEAISEVKDFTGKHADKVKGKLFRVGVEGGGCSGMQYIFTFDVTNEDDHVIAFDDIEILVSETAVPYLKSSVVD